MTRKKIVLELGERYYKKQDLSKATYEYLTKKGHDCNLIDEDIITIDGCKYTINEWNINMGLPIQQVILKKIES